MLKGIISERLNGLKTAATSALDSAKSQASQLTKDGLQHLAENGIGPEMLEKYTTALKRSLVDGGDQAYAELRQKLEEREWPVEKIESSFAEFKSGAGDLTEIAVVLISSAASDTVEKAKESGKKFWAKTRQALNQ